MPHSGWTKQVTHPGARCTLLIPITFTLLQMSSISHSSQVLTSFLLRILKGFFLILSLDIFGEFADLCFTTFFFSPAWEALPPTQTGLVPAFLLTRLPSTTTSLKNTFTCFINLWILHSPSPDSLLKMDLLVLLLISGTINTHHPSWKWVSHCCC